MADVTRLDLGHAAQRLERGAQHLRQQVERVRRGIAVAALDHADVVEAQARPGGHLELGQSTTLAEEAKTLPDRNVGPHQPGRIPSERAAGRAVFDPYSLYRSQAGSPS